MKNHYEETEKIKQILLKEEWNEKDKTLLKKTEIDIYSLVILLEIRLPITKGELLRKIEIVRRI